MWDSGPDLCSELGPALFQTGNPDSLLNTVSLGPSLWVMS